MSTTADTAAPIRKTLSHFLTVEDYEAYKKSIAAKAERPAPKAITAADITVDIARALYSTMPEDAPEWAVFIRITTLKAKSPRRAPTSTAASVLRPTTRDGSARVSTTPSPTPSVVLISGRPTPPVAASNSNRLATSTRLSP